MLMITEQERKEILEKYQGNTSDDLLNHLKRNFPVGTTEMGGFGPKKYIIIGDKMRYLENNKKYLVDKLSNIVVDSWSHLGEPVIRRTVKKYIDGTAS